MKKLIIIGAVTAAIVFVLRSSLASVSGLTTVYGLGTSAGTSFN